MIWAARVGEGADGGWLAIDAEMSGNCGAKEGMGEEVAG